MLLGRWGSWKRRRASDGRFGAQWYEERPRPSMLGFVTTDFVVCRVVPLPLFAIRAHHELAGSFDTPKYLPENVVYLEAG